MVWCDKTSRFRYILIKIFKRKIMNYNKITFCLIMIFSFNFSFVQKWADINVSPFLYKRKIEGKYHN